MAQRLEMAKLGEVILSSPFQGLESQIVAHPN